MQKEYSSFLIINPFGIGDVLFSTPLIRNIKSNFPASRIFYLCNKRVHPVLKDNPLISKIFVYERDEFEVVKKVSKLSWIKKIISFVAEIKKENIDIAVDLSLNSQFGFFAWFAGIRKRIGMDYKRRGLFLTDKIKIESFEGKHVVEFYLELLNFLNISAREYPLEAYSGEVAKEWAKRFIEEKNLADNLIVGIAPCGGEAFGPLAEIKRWPKDKFSSLIKLLVKEFKVKIFLFAGPKEKKDIDMILKAASEESASCYEFTSASLQELIALTECCQLVIANDTGPLRFANALGKKIVALFGPIDEKTYGLYPYDSRKHYIVKKDLPCRPCYKKFRLPQCLYDRRCLKDISVDEVFNAVKNLLNNDESKK